MVLKTVQLVDMINMYQIHLIGLKCPDCGEYLERVDNYLYQCKKCSYHRNFTRNQLQKYLAPP